MKGLKLNSESNVILNAAGHKTVTARAPVTLCGIRQSNDLSISLPNKKLNSKLQVKCFITISNRTPHFASRGRI